MKKLYLFDFDGTLTYRDTMFLFLKFYDARKFYWGFVKHIPLFVLMRLGLLNVERVKKSFIVSVLKDQTQEALQQKAQEFFERYYPRIVRENALEFISNMDREKTEGYIITASLDVWTRPFAEKLGLKLLATEARFENGVFTGHFRTKNNNGKEKTLRILQEIKDRKFDKIIAFGDTSGDRPMLELADEGHYRFFH